MVNEPRDVVRVPLQSFPPPRKKYLGISTRSIENAGSPEEYQGSFMCGRPLVINAILTARNRIYFNFTHLELIYFCDVNCTI